MNRSRGLLLPLIALASAGCQRSPPPGPDVAAQIPPHEEVRYPEFESYLARSAGSAAGELGSEVLSELFDQFLDEKLLVRLARDRGLVRGDAPARNAIDQLLGAERTVEATPAEIAAYYAAHRGDFARPERVRLNQLLTEDRATAERARREIAAGADFAQVAAQLAPAQGAAAHRAELARSDLPPALADVIFALKPGEVSKVVAASYGYHVFQVSERLPEHLASLDEAREEIRLRLRQENGDRALRALVNQARARYNARVYERNLPFRYRGSYTDAHTDNR
jgi:hypothetical protein